jgi:hypothetical protein
MCGAPDAGKKPTPALWDRLKRKARGVGIGRKEKKPEPIQKNLTLF